MKRMIDKIKLVSCTVHALSLFEVEHGQHAFGGKGK